MAEDTTSTQQIQIRRNEDFTALYANNVRFEATVWDLKMIFGVLDQSGAVLAVEQHTAISMAWSQVKLAIYYLQVNLGVYELKNGKVTIPPDALPPEPRPLPENLKDDETAKASRDFAMKAYQQLKAESS